MTTTSATPAPVRIASLEIENVKRLRAFGINLDPGENLILTGDNGAGKSSALDGICLALTGTGLEDPIRRGAGKAKIAIKLENGETFLNIEKRITPKGRTLVITGADGAEIKSPQAFLDSLVGSLAFDPLEFVRLGRDAKGRRAQAAMIRDLTGLDTSKLDESYKTIFAERTAMNRVLEEAKAQFKGMTKPEIPDSLEIPVPPAPTDLEGEVSASELIAKRDAMHDNIRRALMAQEEYEQAMAENGRLARMVEEIKTQLAKAEEALKKSAENALALETKATEAAQNAPEDDVVASITQQIADVDTINAGIRARRESAQAAYQAECKERETALRENQEAIDAAKRQLAAYAAKEQATIKAGQDVEALTKKLEGIQEQKITLTRDAVMPVDGMTFDDNGVLINSIPFEQMSTAEQIRISASVAMASNPQLRIILIREGALVNDTHLKSIYEAAKGRSYQVLLEKFSVTPGTEGIHIEDGEVVAIDGKPVNEAEPLTLAAE